MMHVQDQESVNFIGLNLIVIAVVALAIFTYLVLLIRKRWRQNFLHETKKDDSPHGHP